jgi:hypothetical protein
MVDPVNDPATREARSELYNDRRQFGRVNSQKYTFYSGQPTIPKSATGDLILGATTQGVAGLLLNGVGEGFREDEIPCEEPKILTTVPFPLLVTQGDGTVTLEVTYENPQPDDIFQLFTVGGATIPIVNVTSIGPDTVELELFIGTQFVGPYTLRISRADDPENCFSIRQNVVLVSSVCVLPSILSFGPPTSASQGDGLVLVPVNYNVVEPGDIYALFGFGLTTIPGVGVPTGPGSADVTFNIGPTADIGTYTFGITRAADPTCNDSLPAAFTVGSPCPITITDMTSPTGFPVVPPGPPGFPGGSFTVDLVGAGFLTGPLTVTIGPNFFAPNDTIIPDSVVVIDDNNMTIDFTGNFVSGSYPVRVALTADPTCFDEIGTDPFGPEPKIVLQFF